MNDESIFKYLSPSDNTEISKMSSCDLHELLLLLNSFYLSLRDNLKLDKSVTFGVEIECEKSNNKKIKKDLDNLILNDKWLVVPDASLTKGIEVVSPILRDNKRNWLDLENVCSVISKYAIIDKKAAGHVHVGSHILGNERQSWINFIMLWSVYENIIFRFSYGEYLSVRPSLKEYALPISSSLWYNYEKILEYNISLKSMVDRIMYEKYSAFNLQNVKTENSNHFSEGNTIEFRCPNGTLNSVIWQNNVNFFTKLLLYCRSKNFNNDIIFRRKKINLDEYNSLIYYNEIFLDQALELCDMIFDNNLDKLYFLRQYLKSFKVSSTNNYIKAKPMVKKF